jgi:glycosyltransferase involved in cell wall biosynthesis
MGYSAPEPMKIGMYLSPLKIYEYMSMEVPVLAMGSEDSTNLIENGENGFIISELNSNSIKEQLRKAEKAYRRGELQEMKRKARQMILGNHSWVSRIEYLLSNIELSKKSE